MSEVVGRGTPKDVRILPQYEGQRYFDVLTAQGWDVVDGEWVPTTYD